MGIRLQFNITFGLIPLRYYICIMNFIGLTICYVMRFCITMAITEMVKTNPQLKEDPNACTTEASGGGPTTPRDESNRLDWDEGWQGHILGSFFWGYVCTQIPGGLLADRLGARNVVAISTLLTSLFTILTPPAAHYKIWLTIVVRICLGLSQGCFYASLHTVVACWVPPEERGLWGTLVFSGAHAGNFLSALATAHMIHNFQPHWEVSFYIWGICGAVWAVLFYITTFDNYKQAPGLSEKEIAIFEAYYEKVSKKKKVAFTPWKEILTSMPVWAILLGMVGHDWGLFALVVDIPKYMKQVLRFNIKQNGLYVAMGYLVLCIVAYAFGWVVDLIDRKGWMSKTWNRILFTSVASVGPSVGLIGVSYMKCERTGATILLILGMCTMGTFYPSLKVNPIDLTTNHAGVVGAMGHTVGALSGIAVPSIVGAMTKDEPSVPTYVGSSRERNSMDVY